MEELNLGHQTSLTHKYNLPCLQEICIKRRHERDKEVIFFFIEKEAFLEDVVKPK